jgi:hypothetical protein
MKPIFKVLLFVGFVIGLLLVVNGILDLIKILTTFFS